ncbi:MAG TPA: helix-turn-helix transcriptional regulator [Asticcacaulis sp.]
MPKTVFTGHHQDLVQTLIAARKASGLTQTELAERLGKDQTFISLVERSQRRIDVLEFYAYAKALGVNPLELYAELISRLPEKLPI